MLVAKKSRWFEEIFAVYNRNLIKRRFHSLSVSGFENLQEKTDETPLLIYANHTSWWDGLIAFELSRKARLDSFLMMEEENLRRLFLFRKLGVFSVSKKPRITIESLNYAADLLKTDSKRAVWIFPQGKIFPNDARPIRFYKGAAKIIEKVGKCLSLPVTFRYEHLGNFKPEIFVKIGKPDLIVGDKNFDVKKFTDFFSNKMTVVLNDLKTDVIIEETESYHKII